jgi:hypothetical protein
MSAIPFDRMPGSARVWLFGASRSIPSSDAASLMEDVDRFLDGWHAHGTPVIGARSLLADRFLAIAADEEASGVSGCSIDSLFRTLQGTEKRLGVSLLDNSLVHFRDPEGEIRSVPRAEFRQMTLTGEVDDSTPVFDTTVRSVGQLRSGGWEKRLADSWHGRAFGRG